MAVESQLEGLTGTSFLVSCAFCGAFALALFIFCCTRLSRSKKEAKVKELPEAVLQSLAPKVKDRGTTIHEMWVPLERARCHQIQVDAKSRRYLRLKVACAAICEWSVLAEQITTYFLIIDSQLGFVEFFFVCYGCEFLLMVAGLVRERRPVAGLLLSIAAEVVQACCFAFLSSDFDNINVVIYATVFGFCLLQIVLGILECIFERLLDERNEFIDPNEYLRPPESMFATTAKAFRIIYLISAQLGQAFLIMIPLFVNSESTIMTTWFQLVILLANVASGRLYTTEGVITAYFLYLKDASGGAPTDPEAADARKTAYDSTESKLAAFLGWTEQQIKVIRDPPATRPATEKDLPILRVYEVWVQYLCGLVCLTYLMVYTVIGWNDIYLGLAVSNYDKFTLYTAAYVMSILGGLLCCCGGCFGCLKCCARLIPTDEKAAAEDVEME